MIYIGLYRRRFYGLTIQIICDRIIDTDHIIWVEFIARTHSRLSLAQAKRPQDNTETKTKRNVM